MGFLDLVKNLFGKKEQPPPTSPSESANQPTQSGDGQFMNPQNPANSQNQTPPSEPQQ